MDILHELITGWALTLRKWSVQLSIANGTWFTFWTAAYIFNRVPEHWVVPILALGGFFAFASAVASNLPQDDIKTVRTDHG